MLQFGFFENFDGQDTLLIWGDSVGFNWLYTYLRDFADGKVGEVELNRMAWATAVGEVKVFLGSCSKSKDMIKSNLSENGRIIYVQCSAEQFAEFAEKIDILRLESCIDGHQYLDTVNVQSLQIVASKGEYPSNFGQAVTIATGFL